MILLLCEGDVETSHFAETQEEKSDAAYQETDSYAEDNGTDQPE